MRFAGLVHPADEDGNCLVEVTDTVTHATSRHSIRSDQAHQWLGQELECLEEYEAPLPCQWFALCDRDATQPVAHPILGDVLCCDRCAAVARGEVWS